jgi:hypothetical protein
MYRTTVAERVELGLMVDHSAWAKSVVWSCGRPGFKPMFDWDEIFRRDVAFERMRAYVGLGIDHAESRFKVTGA